MVKTNRQLEYHLRVRKIWTVSNPIPVFQICALKKFKDVDKLLKIKNIQQKPVHVTKKFRKFKKIF